MVDSSSAIPGVVTLDSVGATVDDVVAPVVVEACVLGAGAIVTSFAAEIVGVVVATVGAGVGACVLGAAFVAEVVAVLAAIVGAGAGACVLGAAVTVTAFAAEVVAEVAAVAGDDVGASSASNHWYACTPSAPDDPQSTGPKSLT